jgi:hypothetical protein
MMILANQYVASKIYDSFPDSSLLRIHRAVLEDRFEELESALKAAGISFVGSSNMALADSLKRAKQEGKGNKLVNSLWQSLATRYIFVQHLGSYVVVCTNPTFLLATAQGHVGSSLHMHRASRERSGSVPLWIGNR